LTLCIDGQGGLLLPVKLSASFTLVPHLISYVPMFVRSIHVTCNQRHIRMTGQSYHRVLVVL